MKDQGHRSVNSTNLQSPSILLNFVLKLIVQLSAQGVDTWIRVNDPSAGSPTETLLRLLLPLNDQV